MNDVHVVPNGHGWTIEAGETHRDDFHTQVEAILVGCRLASERGCEVVVHGAPATSSVAPSPQLAR
jgi:Uncharacterized protein conserved in bacteria (DUF2188)